MEGGSDHDLLSLETTSTKGEEDKNEEGNKEEGKLAEGEGGEGMSTSQFPPPTSSLPSSLPFSIYSPLIFLSLAFSNFPVILSPFLPPFSFPFLPLHVLLSPFPPFLLISLFPHCLPSSRLH